MIQTRTLRHTLVIIALLVWLCGSAVIGMSRSMIGSTQGGPTVQLPKVEHPHEGGIAEGSFIVTVPAEGEFYVAGRRLSAEGLAVAIREGLRNKRSDEQKIYIRSGATLKFNAVRQVLNIMRAIGYDLVAFVVENSASGRSAILESQIFVPYDVKIDPRDHITLPPPPRETAVRPAPVPPPPPPPPPPPRRQPKVLHEPRLISPNLVVEITTKAGSIDPVIALNRKPVPLGELRSTVSSLFNRTPESPIVKPSRDVAYADVITVMDEIRGAEIAAQMRGGAPLAIVIDEMEVPNGTADLPYPPPEEPRIIRKSGGVLKGTAIRQVEATTPPMAKTAHVTGFVVVEVTVDEKGDVISARAITGHPLLKEAAVKAARGWKFNRTELSGVPVKVIGTLTFEFKE